MINGKKVILIMDEVDGMSAGDRGGAAEMAKLIKHTKVKSRVKNCKSSVFVAKQ
jgi:hypothetical protein